MEVDEQLVRRINRQLRAIKIMMGFFFVMLIGMLAILGYITYKVVTFTQQVNSRISNIQQTTSQKLDIKKQLCGNDSNGYLAQQFCESLQ